MGPLHAELLSTQGQTYIAKKIYSKKNIIKECAKLLLKDDRRLHLIKPYFFVCFIHDTTRSPRLLVHPLFTNKSKHSSKLTQVLPFPTVYSSAGPHCFLNLFPEPPFIFFSLKPGSPWKTLSALQQIDFKTFPYYSTKTVLLISLLLPDNWHFILPFKL